MSHEVVFNSILIDNVRVPPSKLSSNIKSTLKRNLQSRFEGKCSKHGFILPDTISIIGYSMGVAKSITLNGDVDYLVQYNASVCNPAVGSVVLGKVTNMNKLGLLAESYIDVNDEKYPVIETIIVANSSTNKSEVDIASVGINDLITIEIVGKKFELNDKKISAIGRILNAKNKERTKLLQENANLIVHQENDNNFSEDSDIEEEEDKDGNNEENEENEVEEVENDAEDEADDIVEGDADAEEVDDEGDDDIEEGSASGSESGGSD